MRGERDGRACEHTFAFSVRRRRQNSRHGSLATGDAYRSGALARGGRAAVRRASVDCRVLGEEARPRGTPPREARGSRRADSRAARAAGRGGAVDQADRREACRQRWDCSALAGAVPARNRSRRSKKSVPRDAQRRASSLPGRRRDGIRAPARWASSLPAVPDRRRGSPPAACQGDPRHRGRRQVPALRLRPVGRGATGPSRRSQHEIVRHRAARSHAIARAREGRGGEMRAAVRELPCGSGGGRRAIAAFAAAADNLGRRIPQ